MPDLVFEAVVEDQAFAFFPFKRPIFDPNEGVLWSLDTEMDAQPLVAETAVGRQMRAGAQAGQHDHAGAPYGLRQPFDDGGRHRKPRRAARDPNTGLVEHDLIPGAHHHQWLVHRDIPVGNTLACSNVVYFGLYRGEIRLEITTNVERRGIENRRCFDARVIFDRPLRRVLPQAV